MRTVEDIIQDVVSNIDFGRASARKRGSNPKFPYVPVVETVGSRTVTRNPALGRAYATREEAISVAQRTIDRQREILTKDLGDRRHRALRQHHGLPREIEDLERLAQTTRGRDTDAEDLRR